MASTAGPNSTDGREGRPTLTVVGATGAVGAVLRDLLSTRLDVYGEIRLVASPRSAGRTLTVRGEPSEVVPLGPEVFDGADIAIFAVPPPVAAEWAPVAAARGTVVVDASPVFRTSPGVPLVVPEVNPERVRDRPRGIIASPGCPTLSMIVAIGALHHRYGLRELVVSSYQAASGAGRSGIETLYAQMEKVGGDRALGNRAGDVRGAVGEFGPFPAPLAMNVVPWTGSLGADGWTSDELGIRDETRKVLRLPDLKVAATCVRVPVTKAHSLSVHAVFGDRVDQREAQAILAGSPGVVLCDNPESHEFPTPADVVGTDPTWAGRVRCSLDDPKALELFLCGDSLRKGAALNAAQIAELIATEL
ncbi:aspartate-semialdehyde dehydrogenase [Actinomadura sp. NEAU-AAG7]|uniref:aspartate-semialdehyde dehydrogenase n=1 Tax=Actinomadura sp. NEAU-AAG7 TaxID=2839640 RepID=UPI001BE3E40D|nr:aspartate-semialdehyde dehydrogenase [Actinomadura sp. NEAU-AAG7]MBT2206874.1 aspartate-semialdehyde dehydrogenase [Actinomadura sp. NEAU-AAG7]